MNSIDISINKPTYVNNDINSSETIVFSKNQNKKYTHEIDTDLFLYIERVKDETAHMYFTDKYSNYVDIPEGFVLYDYNSVVNLSEIESSNSSSTPLPNPLRKKEAFSFVGANMPEDVRPPYITSFYVIHSNEYYDITYNNNILFKLTPNYSLAVITEF